MKLLQIGILLQFTFVIVLVVLPYDVNSHGYLIEPPSRSSAWTKGFNTPNNYNDNQSNCGGLSVSFVFLLYIDHVLFYKYVIMCFKFQNKCGLVVLILDSFGIKRNIMQYVN